MNSSPGLFETGLFIPRYQPVQLGRWRIVIGGPVLSPGYWSGPQLMPEVPALLHDDALWMSMSPLEIESAEIGIRLAHGHVAICGLGMGWAAAATAMQDAVTRVTVVERDPEVLALHRALDIFAQIPAGARDKIAIEQGDALDWRPGAPVDLLMPDIWLPLVSDGRVDEVRRMQANVRAAAVYFWGQELEIARHSVAGGRAIDRDGIAATIADFDLPLLGLEWPDYSALVSAAAERWMRDRWLAPQPQAATRDSRNARS